MIIFFAAVGNKRAKKAAMSRGVKNYLISYLQGRSAFDLNADVMSDPSCNLLVDSGAFTAWSQEKPVDINKYADFGRRLKEKCSCGVRFVNLDVIPGRLNRRPTNDEREESAKEGWKNYVFLTEKQGLPVMHVFHQHENFHWLEKLATASDYIGVSPANDVSVKERNRWLDRVFALLGSRVRTHGFAVTSTDLLTRYPFYSVDSTTWLNGAKFGTFVKFLRRRPTIVQVQRDHCSAYIDEIHKDVVQFSRDLNYRYGLGVSAFLDYQEMVTRLWESKGISWKKEYRA